MRSWTHRWSHLRRKRFDPHCQNRIRKRKSHSLALLWSYLRIFAPWNNSASWLPHEHVAAFPTKRFISTALVHPLGIAETEVMIGEIWLVDILNRHDPAMTQAHFNTQIASIYNKKPQSGIIYVWFLTVTGLGSTTWLQSEFWCFSRRPGHAMSSNQLWEGHHPVAGFLCKDSEKR